MTTISRYLEAEVIDPALPRDSFVPPEHDDELGDVFDPDEAGIDIEGDDDE